MKRALLAATALLSSTIISTQALAAVTVLDSVTPAAADGTTLAAMETQCNTLAAAHDTGDGSIWTGTVVPGDVSWVSGPTEVGSHTYAANGVGDQDGAGTFTPAHKEILGDPFRNGGSVNMFGIQQAVGGHYSNSSYDFEGQFTSTYSHAFSCDISVQVFHPGDPPVAPDGWYTNPGHPTFEGDINLTICANGDGQPWGTSYGQCVFHPGPYSPGTEGTLDPDTFFANEAGTAVNQDQTDTLLAHEDFGEGFDTSETLLIGTVVVCISPGKKGGTWTQQNGYTGSKCTTTWYNGGAMVGVPNLNDGSHNWVTVPVI